jgi:hypothetical protein
MSSSVLRDRAARVDHPKCVTTAHPLGRQPAVMFSSVVVGVKELAAGRDALRLAQALTSATGTLTLAHVQVTAPKPAPASGAAGATARRPSTRPAHVEPDRRRGDRHGR